MSNTIFNDRTGFELFLEGIKVPFNAITVREIEGGYPTADLSFPATSGVLHTLPGTVVQFFGPDPVTEEKVLLYEGEITGYSYRKTQGGRYINFSTRSFLEKWKSITARPADAMATKKYKEAAGENLYAWYHLSEEEKDASGQESNSRYSEIVENLEEAVSPKVFGKLKGALTDIRLTESFSFRDEISRLFARDELVDGDIDIFLKFILRKFEIFDPFYGIQANSYNIASSIAGFPNVDNVKIVKMQSALENFFAISQEMRNNNFTSNALVLIVALQELLKVLRFTFIAPSSFTGSYQFWANREGSTEDLRPVRGYMLPNLEHSPPAKFNTFFSHQVEDFSFSRNFYGEPTRTVGSITVDYFDTIQNRPGGLEPLVIEPNLDLTQEGSEKNSMGFTPEESYQGIRPMFKNFGSMLAQSMGKLFTDGKPALKKEEIDDFNAKESKALRDLTIGEHYKTRYANRSCNIRAVWNPHRMVGVPGVYIEGGDGPSFCGMVSGITNVYDGRGNVSSTVSMRAVRVIEDVRPLVQENPGVLEDVINEFTRDPFPDINSNLYDPSVYRFDKIGKTVYPLLRWGTLGGDPQKEGDVPLKDYAESGRAYSDYSENINDLYKTKKNVKEDCSILGDLRSSDGEIVVEQSQDFLSNTAKDQRKSANYTKWVYLAVYKLKDKYKSFGEDNAKGLDRFTGQYTFRQLITKEDYLTSVNVNQAESLSNPVNYKDGMELFTGTKQMTRIKDAVEDSDNAPLEDIIKAEDISRLIRQARRLKSELYDLASQFSVGVLKNGEGESAPTLPDTGSSSFASLFDVRLFDPIDNPQSAAGKKTDIDLAQKFEERKQQLKEVEDALRDLDVNPDKITVDIEVLGKTFDNEVFKPYNLTRKAHIEFGFTKFIRENFKDLQVIE